MKLSLQFISENDLCVHIRVSVNVCVRVLNIPD